LRKAAVFALGLMLASSFTSCRPAKDAPAPLTFAATLTSQDQQAASLALTATGPLSGCPPAVGEGTVAPAIAIRSVTLLVNDIRLTLSEGDTLPAPPGSQVQVVEVALCVGPFSGDAGDACADFAPTGESGEKITPEHAGTHLVPLTSGIITLPGPDHAWIIEDDWTALAAVVNHWPGVKTQDLGCGEANCERDDWLILPLR
jgi:hypothetical protein